MLLLLLLDVIIEYIEQRRTCYTKRNKRTLVLTGWLGRVVAAIIYISRLSVSVDKKCETGRVREKGGDFATDTLLTVF